MILDNMPGKGWPDGLGFANGEQERSRRVQFVSSFSRTTSKRKKRNRPGSKTLRRKLWKKSPYCFYCQSPLAWEQATLDHKIPLSRGGEHSEANCVIACRDCNGEKGDSIVRNQEADRALSILKVIEDWAQTALDGGGDGLWSRERIIEIIQDIRDIARKGQVAVVGNDEEPE